MFTCGIKPFIEALKEDLTGREYIMWNYFNLYKRFHLDNIVQNIVYLYNMNFNKI